MGSIGKERGAESSVLSRAMSGFVYALSLGITALVGAQVVMPAAFGPEPALEVTLTGVVPAGNEAELPRGTHTNLALRERCGPYTLYPEVEPRAHGAERVVYFTAVRTATHRADYRVGPSELPAFRAQSCKPAPVVTDGPSTMAATPGAPGADAAGS